MARRSRRTVRRAPPRPSVPCRNVRGSKEGTFTTTLPWVFFSVANARLLPQGVLHHMTPTGARKVNVTVRRVDYVGPTGNLILRIVPGAPVPEPSDNVRQIRVCYVDPTPRRRVRRLMLRR